MWYRNAGYPEQEDGCNCYCSKCHEENKNIEFRDFRDIPDDCTDYIISNSTNIDPDDFGGIL